MTSKKSEARKKQQAEWYQKNKKRLRERAHQIEKPQITNPIEIIPNDHKIIIKTIAEIFNIQEKEIRSKSQKAGIVYPRQVAMYFLRKKLNLSYPAIGKILGGRDHTTIMYGCQKIASLFQKQANKH